MEYTSPTFSIAARLVLDKEVHHAWIILGLTSVGCAAALLCDRYLDIPDAQRAWLAMQIALLMLVNHHAVTGIPGKIRAWNHSQLEEERPLVAKLAVIQTSSLACVVATIAYLVRLL